jgi:hypothetical protein
MVPERGGEVLDQGYPQREWLFRLWNIASLGHSLMGFGQTVFNSWKVSATMYQKRSLLLHLPLPHQTLALSHEYLCQNPCQNQSVDTWQRYSVADNHGGG